MESPIIKEREKLNAGFTLVELLVSAAILLILSALTITAFANYARTQQYNRAIDDVRNNLSLVRAKTIASLEDTVYGVYVGTTTIEFFEGSTPNPGDNANTIIDLSDLGLEISASFSDGEEYITFKRLTGESSATGEIIISQSSTGASTTLTILPSGLVQ